MNLFYFRKCKEKYVTMALEWLPIFQEGCISVFLEKHTNTP